MEKEINYSDINLENLFPKDLRYPDFILSEEAANATFISGANDHLNVNNYDYLQHDINVTKISLMNLSNNENKTPFDIKITADNIILYTEGSHIKFIDLNNLAQAQNGIGSNIRFSNAHTNNIEGGANNTNYINLTPFIDIYEPSEHFHCLELSEILDSENRVVLFLLAAGKTGVIKVVNLHSNIEFPSLYGHKNEINEIKTHPDYQELILSASKDYSVRLWNYLLNVQIAIFGGHEAHHLDVISIDWHISGALFVSGGLDNHIKVWKLEKKVIQAIDNVKNSDSYNKMLQIAGINPNDIEGDDEECDIKFFIDKIKSIQESYFNPVIIIDCPVFSNKSIHNGYVDCVRFKGNLILSKSTDGEIKEWFPLFKSIFSQNDDAYFLINRFIYEVDSLIWFIKFDLTTDNDLLVISGKPNHINVFQTNVLPVFKDRNSDYLHSAFTPMKIIDLAEFHVNIGLIRKAVLNEDKTFICAISDNHKLILIQLN